MRGLLRKIELSLTSPLGNKILNNHTIWQFRPMNTKVHHHVCQLDVVLVIILKFSSQHQCLSCVHMHSDSRLSVMQFVHVIWAD